VNNWEVIADNLSKAGWSWYRAVNKSWCLSRARARIGSLSVAIVLDG